MPRAAIQVATCFCLLPCLLKAQLYLVAGSAKRSDSGSRYSSALLEVVDGHISEVFEIESSKNGTDWIAFPDDQRRAIFLSDPQGSRGGSVSVLDLDKVATVKTCVLPSDPDSSLVQQWLADVPGKGLSFDWWIVGSGGHYVQGMNLDPSVPCENSFQRVLEEEEKYIVAHGKSGVSDVGSTEGALVKVGENGRLRRGPPERQQEVSFEYQIPSEFRGVLPKDLLASIIVNNSKMLIVGLVDRAILTDARLLAFRKSDRTWHVLSFRSDDFSLRGFGIFAAGIEARTKQAITAQLQKHPWEFDTSTEAVRTNEESAGRSEWREERTSRGPSVVESLETATAIYPGRLHIYNIETEKLFTIETKQGDSEILLIEDNVVYYRVSDRLYQAPLTDSGIGAAKLLATDEAIRDAHWAFVKRK